MKKQAIIRYFFSICFCLLVTLSGYGQVTIGSLEPPQKAALLDLKTDVNGLEAAENISSDKGLLLPRVNLVSLNSLVPFIPTPTDLEKQEHTGLTVYNLNISDPFRQGVYIWDGQAWEYVRTQQEVPVLDAANGISKDIVALRLGGQLIENTTIDVGSHNFGFDQTTGVFSINTDALVVSGGNTGIGSVSIPSSKLTVGSHVKINGDLHVAGSSSSLKQTTIRDTLFYKDPSVPSPVGCLLKSLDINGTAGWTPVGSLPGLNESSYVEGTFTGQGISMGIGTWNNTSGNYNRPINTAKITLPPGLWLVYMSLVVEPENEVNDVAEPIWGRFTLRENNSANPGTGTSGYTELGTNTSNDIYRIGALHISDRVYPNIKKNVIKGYIIIRVKNTNRNLYPWVGSRDAPGGYTIWPTSVSNVKIGDATDPQNYIIAFPLQ